MPRRYTTTSHSALNIGTVPPVTAAPLTMACWYRPTTLSLTSVLMQLGDYLAVSVNQKFRMMKSSGNQLQFIVGTTSISTLTNTSITMGAGVWYHCLVSANTSFSPNRAVINGNSATLTSANRIPVGVNSLVVGAQLSGVGFADPANGDIFWPAVWNAQLTADEEALLANGLSPLQIRRQNLVFFNYADDQRSILLDAISNYHLGLTTQAGAAAPYVPDIPPQVAARMPRRAARVYGFATGTVNILNFERSPIRGVARGVS